MNIKEVQDRYHAKKYESKLRVPDKVKKGHVFDEELSVKRNKEMVSLANLNRQIAEEERRKDSSRLEELLDSDVTAALIEEYELSMGVATYVRQEAWERWHSNMHEYFEEIGWLAEIVANALKMSK